MDNSGRKFTMGVAWETEFKGTATVGGGDRVKLDPYPEGGPMRKTVRFAKPATRPVVE